MDSVTQAALGATIAGAIAGKQCNAKVLLAGAALGTLPDLDVVIDYGDAVSNTIKHRGFSHSLLLLPGVSLLIAWLYARFRPDAFWHFGRLFALVFAVLITHPLLDTMTTYGTQLIWPFHGYFEVSNIFIIDPLYTLPLLFAIGFALLARTPTVKRKAAQCCSAALVVSTLYLGWGYAAQQHIAQRVTDNLQQQNLPSQQVLISPTPFNTVLWRIVVVGEDQYWEGLASIFDEQSQIDFMPLPLGQWPLENQPETLTGLQSFSHNFLSYRQEGDQLIVADLRLGMASNLAFEFVFAQKHDGQWQTLAKPLRYPSERSFEQMGQLWQRLTGDQTIDAALNPLVLSHTP